MRHAFGMLGIFAALAAGACGDGTPTGPVAGDLVVRLTTENTGARGILFRLDGAQSSVSAPSGTGYRVFTTSLGPNMTLVAVVAPMGSTLAGGALVRVNVPDVGAFASYAALPAQVTGTNYAIIPNTAFFTLTVVQP